MTERDLGELDDEELDVLLDQLDDRAEERGDAWRERSGVSRRQTIAGLLGIGGLATGAMSRRAAAAGESWGDSSGTVGTDSKPLQAVNAQDGDFQTVETDQQTLNDTATDPSTAGEFRRNGTDVKVLSGGSVRNLTNIGSGGGGETGGVTGVVDASDYSGTTGADQIQAAVDDADATAGPNVVYVPAQGPDDVSGSSGATSDSTLSTNAWEYSSRVTLPDNTHVVLAGGGYHFLGDSANVGFFGNADRSGGNSNISVVGWGGMPILDGNAGNQSNNASGTEYNALMWWVNVDDLHIESYKLIDSYEWNHRFRLCSDITGGNLAFDNSHVHGDGVHFLGCEDVELSGLSGSTGDDFIAIGTGGDYESNSSPYGSSRNITITGCEMSSTAYAAFAKIMPSADYQIEDITISGFAASPADDQQGVVVRAADTSSGSLPANEDCREITISDGQFDLSYSSVLNAPFAVVADGACSEVTVADIQERGNHSTTYRVDSSGTANNVTLSNIVDNRPSGGGSGLDIDGSTTNITINGWKLINAGYVFNSDGSVDGVANDVEAPGTSNSVYRPGKTGDIKFGDNCPIADNMPPHVAGSIVTASSSADPDGDGNGEIVISDGSSWNEMADMPGI